MELDDLKNIWSELGESVKKTDQELLAITRKKSHSALEKVMRNMMMEIIVAAVMCVGLSIGLYFYMKLNAFAWFLGIAVLATVLQAWLFYKPYRLMQALSTASSINLKDWLNQVLFTIETFIKQYKRFMMWALPISLVIGAMIGFSESNNDNFLPLSNPDKENDMAYFIGIIAFALLMIALAYGYVFWIIRYLYQKYLTEIKACLQSLEEESK
jgi:hypothetical protein